MSDSQTTNTDSGIEAFESFYILNYKQTVALAKSRVDRLSIAEEIVQEAFNTIWQKWDDLENPAYYLRKIVSNRCKDELRKRLVHRNNRRFLESEVHPEKPYLTDALLKISNRKRTAIILRYFGGRTTNEIAEAMEIPAGTAKSLLHRGMSDLRLAMA